MAKSVWALALSVVWVVATVGQPAPDPAAFKACAEARASAEKAWTEGRWADYLDAVGRALPFAYPAEAGRPENCLQFLSHGLAAGHLLGLETPHKGWLEAISAHYPRSAELVGPAHDALRGGVDTILAFVGKEPDTTRRMLLAALRDRLVQAWQGVTVTPTNDATLCALHTAVWTSQNVPPLQSAGADLARFAKLPADVAGKLARHMLRMPESNWPSARMGLQAMLGQHLLPVQPWAGLLGDLASSDEERLRIAQSLVATNAEAAILLASHSFPPGRPQPRSLAKIASVLGACGAVDQALGLLSAANNEAKYPDKRLMRCRFYQQLVGGPGKRPEPLPWLPQPKDFVLPPSRFNGERLAAEARLKLKPDDPDLRLAVADLSGAFWPGSDAWRVYADVAKTATDPPLRIAAWLAWAEAKPADAWPLNVELHNPLLALPDEEGLKAMTAVGLAAVAAPQGAPLRDNVLNRLLPLWSASRITDPLWRTALARAATAGGRHADGLALLAPCGLSAVAAFDALNSDSLPDTSDICSYWLANAAFGSAASDRPSALRRAGWDLAVLNAIGAAKQAPAKDLTGLWTAALSRSPLPDDAAAQSSRRALRGAVVARLKAASRSEVEAVLVKAAAPLTKANKEALAGDVTALANDLLPLLGAEPSLATEQLTWELGKLGVTWQH